MQNVTNQGHNITSRLKQRSRTYLSAPGGFTFGNTGRLNKKFNLNLGRVSAFDRPLGGRAESDGFDPWECSVLPKF